jgi:hypothetical protein
MGGARQISSTINPVIRLSRLSSGYSDGISAAAEMSSNNSVETSMTRKSRGRLGDAFVGI